MAIKITGISMLPDGRIIGMDTFGESAPAGDLFKEFGFTVKNVLDVVQEFSAVMID